MSEYEHARTTSSGEAAAIELIDVTVFHKGKRRSSIQPALSGVNLSIPGGSMTAIIGTNGAGKSTLLNTISGLIQPASGQIRVGGIELHRMDRAQRSKLIGLLPQAPLAPDGVTVTGLMARSRMGGKSRGHSTVEDTAAIADAMGRLGVGGLADRMICSLSGGQLRRVWLAFAIARQTDVILLDEPTTFLDLARSVEVLSLLDSLSAETGQTIVMVLHDLNLAARHCDHLIVVDDGVIVRAGPPSAILNPGLLAQNFDLNAAVSLDPDSGCPLVIPTSERPSCRASIRV